MKTDRRRNRAGRALAAIAVLSAACSAARPENLGLVDRHLRRCPASPNCASTAEERFAIRAIPYEGTRDEARQRLVDVIGSMPGARIATVAPHYVRAEVTSRLFRFVDDVEASLDDSAKVIHLRSASRLGYWDLGVNHARLEEIRSRFLDSAARADHDSPGTTFRSED